MFGMTERSCVVYSHHYDKISLLWKERVSSRVREYNNQVKISRMDHISENTGILLHFINNLFMYVYLQSNRTTT